MHLTVNVLSDQYTWLQDGTDVTVINSKNDVVLWGTLHGDMFDYYCVPGLGLGL